MQHMHMAMSKSTEPIFTFYFSCKKRLKKILKGEGHLSGGNWRSNMLKKEIEGELAHRILKLAKNGFPLTGKKVCQTAYKFARENGIKGFSMKYEAAGYKWLWNFKRRHEHLKI